MKSFFEKQSYMYIIILLEFKSHGLFLQILVYWSWIAKYLLNIVLWREKMGDATFPLLIITIRKSRCLSIQKSHYNGKEYYFSLYGPCQLNHARNYSLPKDPHIFLHFGLSQHPSFLWVIIPMVLKWIDLQLAHLLVLLKQDLFTIIYYFDEVILSIKKHEKTKVNFKKGLKKTALTKKGKCLQQFWPTSFFLSLLQP